MKNLVIPIILLSILISYSDAAIVKIDNGEPKGNSYQASRAFWEESIRLTPAGPCSIDSIHVYLSGDTPVIDTLWVVGFPTAGDFWPTQYCWDMNQLIDPIEYDYEGTPGWRTFDIKNMGLRSEGIDIIIIQHRLKPNGPWFTYDNDGYGNSFDSWVLDPFTETGGFKGILKYNISGDYMIRLTVTYDLPDGETSAGPPPPFLLNVSNSSGISGGGMTSVVDWNNDGWDDLVNGGIFFQNNGNGTFKNINTELSIERGNSTWGDINNDGLLDVFILKSWGNDKIYLNNGSNSYTDITEITSIINDHSTMTPVWFDYNNDGLVDLFIANNRSGSWPDEIFYPDQLWRNNGDSTFTNVRDESGIAAGEPSPYYDCYGAAACDYNKDNLQDIFVANYRLAKDNLYKNNGDDTFDEVGAQTGVQGTPTAVQTYFGHGMGCDWGDFNNDGYIDLAVGNLAHTDYRAIFSNPSLIFKNNGPPNYDFEEVHQSMGLKFYEFNSGILWLDLDLDGYLDLWHGIYSGGVNHLYLNQGPPDYKLKEITWISGSIVPNSWTASRIDYDNDGDLDIIIYGSLYRNDIPRKGKWLQILLSGSPENNVNMDAYGSKVTVYSGDKLFFRELAGSAGGSRCMQNSNYIHFGLGEIEQIDSLEVVYPNGEKNIITVIEPNAKYHIPYMGIPEQIGLATPALKYPKSFESRISNNVTLEWHLSAGAENYLIQLNTSDNFTSGTFQEFESNILSLSDVSLEANGTYYWRVKAASAEDTSAWSSIWSFTVGLAKPSIPDLLTPSNNSNDVSALPGFTWSSVSYNCSYCSKNSYEIQISEDELFEGNYLVSLGDITDSTYKMENSLTPGITFYWRVRGMNEEQPGDWSATSSFSTMPLPDTPLQTEPVDEETEVNEKPKFSWESADYASFYQLQVSVDADFVDLVFEANNLKSNTYRNLGEKLTSGTRFYWRIQAINDGGEGDWSETWSFTTQGTAPSVDESGLLNSLTKLEIFPNPVSDLLTLKLFVPVHNTVYLSIHDINGTELLVLCPDIIQGEYQDISIDINNFSSGLYYCRLVAGKINKTVKFAVIK
ncbi:FG-GAP-like repeat-containing protein [Bacteroidota bacterium]